VKGGGAYSWSPGVPVNEDALKCFAYTNLDGTTGPTLKDRCRDHAASGSIDF
jgi:hypothetical protein